MAGVVRDGSYAAYVVDVDGVLTRGPQPLPGAIDALRILQARARVVLLTNNSTRSRTNLASHLSALGFAVAADDVFATSYLAAHYLRDLAGAAYVWVVGEEGLRSELAEAGHHLAARPTDAAWVVVGMDRNLDYASLNQALQALLAGARLLVTNEDATYPTAEGLVPGAGAVVGALRGMGYAPVAVIGKPSPLAYEIALRELGEPKEKVLVVGDRLDTDIAGGTAAGMDTALVLSGVSSLSDLARSAIRPTWLAASFADLCAGRVERCSAGEPRPSSAS
jgi:HAD superfamily hydrolase (TIGR01457 family)